MNQPANDFNDIAEHAQRGANNPTDSLRFQCPACRARQPLQNDCRRCGADLSLLVAVRRRVAFLEEQIGLANKDSTEHKRFTKELRMIVGKVPSV